MQVWAIPALFGLGFLIIGALLIRFPQLVGYIVGFVFGAGGVILLLLAYSMYREARKLEQIIEETEKEIEQQMKEIEQESGQSGETSGAPSSSSSSPSSSS